MSIVVSKIQTFDSKLVSEREYWTERLSGEIEASNLRLDFERPIPYAAEKDIIEINLSTGLQQKLSKVTGNSSFLIYVALLATLKIGLHKHTGNRTIVVGSPCRSKEGEPEPKPNALALLDEIDGRMSFRNFLLRVRETLVEAYARQNYPFHRLLKDLHIPQQENRCALFDVVLLMSNLHGEMPELLNDITMIFHQAEDGLSGCIEYNSRLFRRSSIEKFTGHFTTLLERALDDIDAPIWRLDPLSQAEREQILYGWNNTGAAFPERSCLHQLCEAQAARSPQQLALISGEQQFTYAELDALSNQIAHLLRAQGIAPDSLVAICCDHSPEMLMALLGILKAGAAYLPLDPSHPAQRLSYILNDAAPSLLLTQQHLLDRLPAHAAQVITLDALSETLQGYSTAPLESGVSPDNLIYVIYTSGSTGQPKGAMNTHKGVVNCLHWMQQAYRLDMTDRFLARTSLTFDPSVWELFWPLTVGATVVLGRAGAQADVAYLLEEIQRQQVTTAYLVPSLLRVFVSQAGVAEMGASLRRVISGGEKLSFQTMERFFECLPGAELHHSYGPTETSIAAAEWLCEVKEKEAADGLDEKRVLMGYALANTELYVLDQQLQPVPAGVAGELYIGGVCVGRGYLGRPQLTAERFIPNPFSREGGARLYRTGDVVRYENDGAVEFVGRVDEQVKVRGHRIELGEIEAAARSLSEVREAIAAMQEDATGEARLVCYVVVSEDAAGELKNGETVSGNGELMRRWRAELGERLPEYMIPSWFVMLDELPLTPTGKINRRALPAVNPVSGTGSGSFVAARTPVEQLIAGLWCEVLHLEEVGVTENFFELGGHSLLATQVISRLREAFGVEVALAALFEQPTISGLAECIEQLLRAEGQAAAPPIVPIERGRKLPLSYAQQRLWFLDQLMPGSAAYNICAPLRLKGDLHVPALVAALQEVVRRHESLRTSFAVVDDEPVQVIHQEQELTLKVEDLADSGGPQKEAEVKRIAGEEAQRPFDLAAGPLVRARLLRLEADEHVLVWTMHHIISDGWSLNVLVREVGELYGTYRRGETSPLERLQVQYADYAVWQREWLQGEVLERELSYWREQLQGAPEVLELPLDRPRSPEQSNRGAEVTMMLTPELTAGLRELNRRERATMFMTLLAAFNVLLSNYSGQQDMIVGTDIANRNRAETEPLIGFFVNQLALRSDLSGNPPFSELLRRVREVTLAAYTHQDVPFEKVVEAVNPERALSHNPLIQAKVVLQNAPGEAIDLAGLTFKFVESETAAAKFDLLLNFWETPDSLGGSFLYSTDLFNDSTVKRMVRHFETLLQTVVANPLARLSELQEALALYDREFEKQTVSEVQAVGLDKLKRTRRKSINVLPEEEKTTHPGPVSMKGAPGRKAVGLSTENLVTLGALPSGGSLPLVIEPTLRGVRLEAWAANNRERVEALLHKHGAVLFRNFDVATTDEFERCVQTLSGQLLEYKERSSPRSQVSGRIYTSTDYPPDQSIFLHNENSYQHSWPMKLFFHCATPAQSGGETPIADCRRVLARLPLEVRERFTEKRLLYVRNFGDGLGLPWQTVFQTDDRIEVEEHCRKHGVRFEWKERDGLRTHAVRTAIERHPQTGEMVWFNHGTFFHVSTLAPEIRQALLAELTESELPSNTYYGDGSAIEPEVLDQLRAAYNQETISFKWEKGDVLMLDNMLVAHGRNPFQGSRKILVGMAELFTRTDS